jgi:hypothetical protein
MPSYIISSYHLITNTNLPPMSYLSSRNITKHDSAFTIYTYPLISLPAGRGTGPPNGRRKRGDIQYGTKQNHELNANDDNWDCTLSLTFDIAIFAYLRRRIDEYEYRMGWAGIRTVSVCLSRWFVFAFLFAAWVHSIEIHT